MTRIAVTSFKRNKSLKKLGNKIENNIVKKINESTLKPGKCSPCFGNSRTLCYNQVRTTLTFKTPFNIRQNNHRNDVKNRHPKTILACSHFQEKKSQLQQTYKIQKF